jgi:ATP-dependent metalloprotease
VSLKEYQAQIDVCMGGRIAESLSNYLFFSVINLLADHNGAVYGPDNVTSGASSDLRQATGVANAMVKVRLY